MDTIVAEMDTKETNMATMVAEMDTIETNMATKETKTEKRYPFA